MADPQKRWPPHRIAYVIFRTNRLLVAVRVPAFRPPQISELSSRDLPPSAGRNPYWQIVRKWDLQHAQTMETLPAHLRLSWIVAIMFFTFVGMWMIDELFINVEQEIEYLQDEE